MNEPLIKQLHDRAGEYADNLGFGGLYWQNAKMKKFAELVIKEYEMFLPEICPWADADKEGPMRGWHVAFVARKHFGLDK
jgi:hypothetical protein